VIGSIGQTIYLADSEQKRTLPPRDIYKYTGQESAKITIINSSSSNNQVSRASIDRPRKGNNRP
jgi:hypothetical protein